MHDATNPFNKLPPQNLDAERGVIGSLLVSARDVIDPVSLILTPEEMYLDAHRLILDAAYQLHRKGIAVDGMTISAELERQNHLEEVGGNEYLMLCVETVLHSAHAVYYAGLVREACKRRKLIYACTQALKDAYEGGKDVPQILEEVENTFAEINGGANSNQAIQISQIALKAMDRYTSPLPEGIELGVRDVDQLVGNSKPGQLIVIAARPGMGKSAFAGGIATSVSHLGSVFFASLEMTKEELFDRGTVSSLGISLGELRDLANGEHSDEVNEAVLQMGAHSIWINDESNQSVSSIQSQARMIQKKHGLALVIVDYLQIVTPVNAKDTREVQVSKIARGLKSMAKTLGVTVIALAQLNRAIDTRPDKTPRLSDLRESGAIEQEANIVMFLDRPHVWDPGRGVHEAIIYVAKNRGGRTGRVDLLWEPRCATFRSQPKIGDDLDLENINWPEVNGPEF